MDKSQASKLCRNVIQAYELQYLTTYGLSDYSLVGFGSNLTQSAVMHKTLLMQTNCWICQLNIVYVTNKHVNDCLDQLQSTYLGGRYCISRCVSDLTQSVVRGNFTLDMLTNWDKMYILFSFALQVLKNYSIN